MRDPLELTLDACIAAIEDAGLTLDDIDGLSTYPGGVDLSPGFSGAGIIQVQDALRLELNWFTGGVEMPGQLGSVINACMAVATGLARHVLCFRSIWESTAQGTGGRGGFGAARIRLPTGLACSPSVTSTSSARHANRWRRSRSTPARTRS
jgi:hypothetical protein